jgi:hypothetical protein
MKKIFELRNILILLLLIIVILEYCNPKGIMPNRVVYQTIVDSVPYPEYDTIEYGVEVEVPIEVLVQVPVEVKVEVEKSVDTAEILKVFYSKNQISETLILPNDVGSITLNETVSENKVIERKITNSKLKKQIIQDTLRIPEEPKNKFYYGFDFSTNRQDFVNSIGLGMMMKTKSDKIYRLDLGLNNRVINGTTGKLSPYLGGGVYWKIKSKENTY